VQCWIDGSNSISTVDDGEDYGKCSNSFDGQGNVDVLSSQVAQELLAMKMNWGQRRQKTCQSVKMDQGWETCQCVKLDWGQWG
jgi:hypothetical protein